MITLRKLASLPDATRLRKIIRMIQGWESALADGNQDGFERTYAAAVLKLLEPGAPEAASAALPAAIAAMELGPDRCDIARPLNGLRHALMAAVGETAADWDFALPGRETGTYRPRFPIGVMAEDIRSPFNVGSIFRTALAFGAEKVYLTPGCPSPDQPRALRSGMGAARAVMWEVATIEEAARRFGGSCFALENGGRPVESFDFPATGLVIVGSEELGISPAARRLAEAGGGIVGIHLHGPKASLGAAVAFGILMSHWTRRLADLPGDIR